jgi:hypothetical protein
MDWSPLLEQTLKGLYRVDESNENGSTLRFYELAPLRQEDVILLAEQEGIEDTQSFLKSVREAQATPFASNPLTLKFLFKQYIVHQDLPKRRVVLLRKGVLNWRRSGAKHAVRSKQQVNQPELKGSLLLLA